MLGGERVGAGGGQGRRWSGVINVNSIVGPMSWPPGDRLLLGAMLSMLALTGLLLIEGGMVPAMTGGTGSVAMGEDPPIASNLLNLLPWQTHHCVYPQWGHMSAMECH